MVSKSAERGSAKAQLNLGLALANGKGVDKNETEGLRWIDCAAQSRLPEARYAQGETYLWGQFGRAVDYKRALAIFRICAEEGNANAQVNLGVLLREGQGTNKDETAAIEWFRKAAVRGNAKAQSLLGHTLGIEHADNARRLEALKWVMLAADQGEITAVKSLEELLPNLAAEQKDEAENSLIPSKSRTPPHHADRFPAGWLSNTQSRNEGVRVAGIGTSIRVPAQHGWLSF
jgi:TPR repeat protein